MKALLALGITAALAATAAHADGVQITGFGQVVAGTVSNGGRNPATGVVSFPGTGYTSEWSFKDESLFALQIRGDLNEQWSATAQIVARGREDFKPEFLSAYVGWNGGNGFSAKVGRQRSPYYRYSDFLDVSYAYPWLRPPHATYNLLSTIYDGGSLGYEFTTGDWFHSVGVFGGSQNSVATIANAPATVKLTSLVGVSFETTYSDWLTLRAGYANTDLTIDAAAFTPFLTSLRSRGFTTVAAAIDINKDPGTFLGLGGEINLGKWLLLSEYTEQIVDKTFSSEKKQFYVTGGYRIGSIMPMLTYGRRDADAKTEIIAMLPNIPALGGLRAATTGIVLSDALNAQYWSYGLRWDVAKNVALKVDYSTFKNKTAVSNVDADSLAFGVTFIF